MNGPQQRVESAIQQSDKRPHWARFGGQDEDGVICIFEYRPRHKESDTIGGFWDRNYCGRYNLIQMRQDNKVDDWADSLIEITPQVEYTYGAPE